MNCDMSFSSSSLLSYIQLYLACDISASLGHIDIIIGHNTAKVLHMLFPKN